MQKFTGSLSFIIFFLVITLFIQMIFGESVTTSFLWLVLASMIVLNANAFTNLLGKVSKA